MSGTISDDGWVGISGSKGGSSTLKVRQGQGEQKAPKQIPVAQNDVHQGAQATDKHKVFGFSWADDVEEELFSGELDTMQRDPQDVSAKQDECIIEGERYRYAPGASRKVPAFSIQTLDRRYEYEGSVSPLGSQPTSPADSVTSPSASSSSRRQQTKPNSPLPIPQTSVQKQIWGKPADGKSRRRSKKHTQPTPPVRPSWEFYEAQEQTDPFTGQLPNAKNLLERVEPPVVEEDLWADYKKKPPRPIYFG